MAKNWCNEKDPTNKKVLAFIKKHHEDIKEVAADLKIPATWILGLSATETGYGTSSIAINANNYFGQTAGATGSIGYYVTSKNVKVAKFKDFQSSAKSFAKDFGRLIRGKKTQEDFVNSLVPKFNTTDPKTNGNPNFKNDTLAGIRSIRNRITCTQLKKSGHRCGAKCKDFETYGFCDRLTTNTYCWQHSKIA